MMHIEHNVLGERQWVSVSRSGKRYVGDTPQESERKLLLATLHAFERETDIGRDVCESKFGTRSFGKLTLEQMRELKKLFAESRRVGEELKKHNTFEPKLTLAQRKRIIRLGLYVLAPHYGKDWFWRKCKEWIVRFRDAPRVNLDDLTNQEAWYLIRRLEKIEKRLLTTGELNEA